MQGLPAPPPSIAYDVNEFRRFFQFGLSQLKYNNKYIINDLTTLASVYHHRMSTHIAKDIEIHIRDSHPGHRLIGFYVIDSICKNLGHPFPELFKPVIERLFLTAYRDVEELDPVVKVKFEELLGTWRTGSANQLELFGPDVQRRIEIGVFGSWKRGGAMFDSQAFLNGIKQRPAVATPAEKASILYDLRRILSERERIAANSPSDQANYAQMVTLQQLEQLVANQQLTLIQVEEIRQQLQPLKPSTPPPTSNLNGLSIEHCLPSQVILPPTPQAISQHLLSQSQPQPQIPAHANLLQALGIADPSSLANLSRLIETNPEMLQRAAQQANSTSIIAPQGNNIIPMPHGSVHSAPELIHQHLPTNLPVDIPQIAQPLAPANVFDSQQIAAALASLNTRSNYDFSQEAPSRERSSEPTNQHSPAPSTLSTGENVNYQHPDPAVMEYENMIAGLDIHLQSASINRAKPEDMCEVLYSCIPQLCRQDGSRFLFGRTGDQRASEQLDWHFRLKRRVRESGQRAQQRMWSQLESAWLNSHDFGVSMEEESARKYQSTKNGQARQDDHFQAENSSMQDLKKKYVIRPSSPGLANKPCPICQEGFETRFDDEEDEFYWINAIESTKEHGKKLIYHAACHYETIRNKARMKMRTELEENRLKRIGEEEEKRKANFSRNVTPAVDSKEGILQEDESFFGDDHTGQANVPRIKVEPKSPSPSKYLADETNSIAIDNIYTALGKRKELSLSDEIEHTDKKSRESFDNNELSKKTKTC
ncbi:hypothetical protein PPACK8108_LOCUS13606 [Phakopsora pachyrhizi]|uniref:CID domain-containing protein n=1 Tax=Phakopsora pachyrhizi TaxID=170000 RepID=A0AAV0B3F0_PHAPC|nr:hypothetical protein PPACK8108_LOCUS13606 [Phakopsora pachyrhizi]